jgi:hypothetical protein
VDNEVAPILGILAASDKLRIEIAIAAALVRVVGEGLDGFLSGHGPPRKSDAKRLPAKK